VSALSDRDLEATRLTAVLNPGAALIADFWISTVS
jgi:hypothetical protein